MGRFRIVLDSTFFINAENKDDAIAKYRSIFDKFDKVLENEQDNVEFIDYIIYCNECGEK